MNGRNVFFARFVVSPQEMSNKEIDLTYKLKVLQQELEQEESSHKASRALLADKSKIKVTIEGAKSESMKGKYQRPSVDCSRLFVPSCCEAVTRHSSLVILVKLPLTNKHLPRSEMEQKLAEERAAKLRLENRILELEKHSSMMECDYKQALQKLDELRIHKDRLSEEVIYTALCRRCI